MREGILHPSAMIPTFPPHSEEMIMEYWRILEGGKRERNILNPALAVPKRDNGMFYLVVGNQKGGAGFKVNKGIVVAIIETDKDVASLGLRYDVQPHFKNARTVSELESICRKEARFFNFEKGGWEQYFSYMEFARTNDAARNELLLDF